MTKARRDQYINNWNIEGFAGKVWFFQGIGRTSPDGVLPETFEFTRIRPLDHGPWAEIENDFERERLLNIRQIIVRDLVRDPATGEQTIVQYDNFRAADIGSSSSFVWAN